MAETDNEIIARVRAGSNHAFAMLIDRYKDRTFTLALRMLKRREEAEEALQDAFVRAYHALPRFEGTASFGTWLYRIVYNVCLTRIARRREEIAVVDYDDDQNYDSSAIHSGDSIESTYESREMIEHIQSIIASMPEKYASVLTLWYTQDLSHEEICEVTELPLGTVKVHLFRARAILRKRLSKEFQMENLDA